MLLAARVRYLRQLHASAPELWERIERYITSRSHHEHITAARNLRDLREAAESQGAPPAFEARIEELRASTPQQHTFWRRWSEAERSRDPLSWTGTR